MQHNAIKGQMSLSWVMNPAFVKQKNYNLDETKVLNQFYKKPVYLKIELHFYTYNYCEIKRGVPCLTIYF